VATPEYGVWGYIYNRDGTQAVGELITVTCSCGGAGAEWESEPSGDDGYWETPFTSGEADAHDGHHMNAFDKHLGDGKAFTFQKPATGPVVIRCT